MGDVFVKKLKVKNFRGISEEQIIDFEINGKFPSLLLFGDNGSGKSSFIDALEYASQGTIHSKKSASHNDWIFSSMSLANEEEVYINIELSDGRESDKSIRYDYEHSQVIYDQTALPDFRFAPYILRRRDITEFWNLKDVERMMIFFPFVESEERVLSMNAKNQLEVLEDERMQLKEKKRKLLEVVCAYYGLDVEKEKTKSREQFFSMVKLLNRNVQLKNLKVTHPQYKNLMELNALFKKILDINAKISLVKRNDQVDSGSQIKSKKMELKRILEEIAPSVTEDFKSISKTSEYIAKINIGIAKINDMSISFSVQLTNGKQMHPVMLFSEANRDLLALLIYFEFIHYQQQKGQASVLVMDDIFQSVDSTVRFKVMQFLIKKFSGWQMIITTHDRLWKEQITQLFRSRGKELSQKEIVRWSFERGPQVVGSFNNLDDKVKMSLESGSASDICASAGYLLEYMCNKLSGLLSVSIHRKEGDRYTIGDLWPGIYKILKKSLAEPVFTELNDLIYLRNVVGSHYNEWSISLSRTEAADFANAVLESYYHVYSNEKARWITSIEDISADYYV